MKRFMAVVKAGMAAGIILALYAVVCLAFGLQIERSVLIAGGFAAFGMLLIRFSRS